MHQRGSLAHSFADRKAMSPWATYEALGRRHRSLHGTMDRACEPGARSHSSSRVLRLVSPCDGPLPLFSGRSGQRRGRDGGESETRGA